MKALLFFLSTAAVFTFSPNNKLHTDRPKQEKAISQACADSVWEAARVERMRQKMM